MKIFNWMHRRLLCFSDYSHFSENKELGEREEAAPVAAAETEALLLHDMLNGILAIGTVGRHHPLISRCHSASSETECYSFGDDEAEEAADDHGRGRDKEAAVFKIKLSVEEETRGMEFLKVCELAHREAEEVPELPLLKRERRRRTTLADLLAVKATRASAAE
ncbi:protein TILLER ANGLE CONTROL 1-like [Curcuma longa]|uniref:protein TILLER ANGLE CONTROL 1-like n=1 Tax=Curcuma longa TaxID=136217 RepID=UPI003D9E24D1